MADIKKILVVDDDVSIINLLTDLIPKVLKHEIYLTLTGEEALKILEEKKPDIVLLDMQLPGINGIQVLKIIRQEYPDTKVLVITSYDNEVKKAVAELGVDGFFPKPILLDEIINRIDDVLKAKDATRVIPVSLDEITRRNDIVPAAKILFIEREFWMPYLLPIQDGEHKYPPPLVEPYGEYEYMPVYCQKEARRALSAFRPDIVICATEVPTDKPHGKKSESTANLISDIMKSKYAPKAIIVHGTQQNINSHGFKDAKHSGGIWIESDDMYNYDEKKDKENAERLNKMIWSICFKHNLIRKVK
ncbi:MAG: response regulator [Candidatus Omnitrophica bacterium]|nr:response regulator [Candidatus Omnitrophota bacterium]